MKEDNISQLGDHDAPFCEQQYMHGSCYMSLFNSNHLISLIPPKLPQILDIRELKQTDAAAERRRSHSNLYSIKSD